MSRILGLVAAACGSVFLAACGGHGVAPVPAAGAFAPGADRAFVATRGSAWSGNLIVNGDAETGDGTASGYDAVVIPGWKTSGLPTAVDYGAPGGFPDSSVPGPSNRGKHFFAGGQLGSSSLSQCINLSAAASAIDAGSVGYDLNGWLGGYGAQGDNARVIVTFRNASGESLGTTQIGPVTPADRKSKTALLFREKTGYVPASTRTVDVTLQNTDVTGYDDGYADNLSFQVSAAVPIPPPPTPPAAHVPAFDHIYEIMMENQWYPQIVGNTAAAPYVNSLIAKGSVLGNMYAVTHPSDPNYVAIGSGSTYGLDTNDWTANTFNVSNLADSIENSGRSWKVYMEGANGACDLSKHGYYGPDDSPYVYFGDIRNNIARCQAHIVPLPQMAQDFASASTTPSYAWIAPDDCDDMEACGITAGDTWLHSVIPTILNSPSWQQGNSIIVLTWDEDDRAHDQHIPALVIGPHVKSGYVSPTFGYHYSILRTIEASWGLPTLTKNDLYANPINDIWR